MSALAETSLSNRIERFIQLEIYNGVTLTTTLTDIIVDIRVEVLTILAIATKEVPVNRERLSESMLCRFTIRDLTDTSVQTSISGSL
jgi:hypothetical protein